MKNPLYNIFLLAFLFCSGCGNFKPTITSGKIENVYTEQELKIAESLNEIPLEDCEKVYKVQIGFVNYLKNTNKPLALKDVFGTEDNFEDSVFFKLYKDFDYKPSYNKFSDTVSEYLSQNGYDISNKTIVESVTDETKEIAEEKVIKDFEVLTNAIKSAIEKKMAE